MQMLGQGEPDLLNSFSGSEGCGLHSPKGLEKNLYSKVIDIPETLGSHFGNLCP